MPFSRCGIQLRSMGQRAIRHELPISAVFFLHAMAIETVPFRHKHRRCWKVSDRLRSWQWGVNTDSKETNVLGRCPQGSEIVVNILRKAGANQHHKEARYCQYRRLECVTSCSGQARQSLNAAQLVPPSRRICGVDTSLNFSALPLRTVTANGKFSG